MRTSVVSLSFVVPSLRRDGVLAVVSWFCIMCCRLFFWWCYILLSKNRKEKERIFIARKERELKRELVILEVQYVYGLTIARGAMPDYPTLSGSEILEHIERCRRLLSNTQVVLRLPDRGESIKNRIRSLCEEVDRGEKGEGNLTTSTLAWEDSCCGERTDGRAGQEEKELERLAEKYRDYRCPIEEKIREIYEGALSEREIQRILDDIPTNYFLTLRETEEMNKRNLSERRKHELEELQAESPFCCKHPGRVCEE